VRTLAYLYDGDRTDGTVEAVLDALDGRDVELLDAGAGPDAAREATLWVKETTRIGASPEELAGPDGLTFEPGVLITEAETGRRSMHIGEEALDALGE
jgi:hypothetical protein